MNTTADKIKITTNYLEVIKCYINKRLTVVIRFFFFFLSTPYHRIQRYWPPIVKVEQEVTKPY